MSIDHTFVRWFQQATGHVPFPFQARFACDEALSQLVHVPTGLGKTAMAVLGWLWRRRFHPNRAVRRGTPRRLVYCLPMRVLVEQTVECAKSWIKNLKKSGELAEEIPVHMLMGGEEEEDWDMYPDREQILVGTQDMLLSRALNRGYAATRSRWPMQFGMLNADCLWVFDEIQLMGAGLATTAQLEAFRRLLPNRDAETAKNSHGCRTVWMSATLQRDWLKTVDFGPFLKNLAELRFDVEQEINTSGLNAQTCQTLRDRWQAKKPLAKSKAVMGDVKALAKEVLGIHKPNTRTIVIVNTVKRARQVFDALRKELDKAIKNHQPELVLLHSRFRSEDREKQVDRALAQPRPYGTIVVSTQVIEAGVDVSATTLFTEVAPWASLVQRFGRCNRRGEEKDRAKVYWIALPDKVTEAEKVAAPYELDELTKAQKQLTGLRDVGLASLPEVPLTFENTHVIRRKDLIDLFDTTPDLAGNDLDIDRFIRDVEDSDVQVFWRKYEKTPNETEEKKAEPAAKREELCPVPIGEFKKFVSGDDRKKQVWRWNFLDTMWELVKESQVVPGQVYLVHANAGGYSTERGWDPSLKESVQPIESARAATVEMPDATDADPLSQINRWQTIAEHTNELCQEVDQLLRALALDKNEADAVRHAARWHDRGKAHEVFQAALPEGAPRTGPWAKASRQGWKRYTRHHFRHELASALAVLDPRNTTISEELRNLVAYLVAAHHGKVRLSIRSLPNESRPDGGRRFARGVWDGDELPETDLGGGTLAPRVTLSLEPIELGLCEERPFAGLPSWAERMIDLRDKLGPFRLAYFEAVLRAADWRASQSAEKGSQSSVSHGGPNDGGSCR
ncbi:MAG: CRISPR-associated helicase Cas3' [Nitrospira sp.]|nr:CRISPR-associated helicase Cas3' [Nitrospira sp.]